MVTKQLPEDTPAVQERLPDGCPLPDRTLSGWSASRGASLLELMVVLAIGMVLMLVSIQGLRSAMENTRLQSDAMTISRSLFMAKLLAGSEFTRSRLRIDTATNQYAVETLDKATNTWVAQSGPAPLGAGISFGSGSVSTPPPGLGSMAPAHPILFNSRGVPVDGMGLPTGVYAVYVTDGRRVIVIRVSLGGRPSILEFRGGAWNEL